MDKVYMTILHERYKYFESKAITELTDDEIKEYLILKEEILESMPEVVDFVKSTWEGIKEYLSPYIEAEKRYKDKVRQKNI